jgi:hypothetical protein
LVLGIGSFHQCNRARRAGGDREDGETGNESPKAFGSRTRLRNLAFFVTLNKIVEPNAQ